MVFTPNPAVLEYLARDRQEQLRRKAAPTEHVGRSPGVRVRIGHALIAAGSTLSGERVEIPARPSPLQRAA
jgi:hypothetical protein